MILVYLIVNQSQENDYIVAPMTLKIMRMNSNWLGLRTGSQVTILTPLALMMFLSNFPYILVVLTEEITDKLVKEGLVSKTGTDTYNKNKQKRSKLLTKLLEYDHMYTKYVTAAKLQSKLDGEANQTTVCKLIDKMTRNGYLEAKGSRRLGKRVIHSSLTEKKQMEVKKILENEAMDVDNNEQRTIKYSRKESTVGTPLHVLPSPQLAQILHA